MYYKYHQKPGLYRTDFAQFSFNKEQSMSWAPIEHKILPSLKVKSIEIFIRIYLIITRHLSSIIYAHSMRFHPIYRYYTLGFPPITPKSHRRHTIHSLVFECLWRDCMNASEPLIAKVRSGTISLTPLKVSNFIL